MTNKEKFEELCRELENIRARYITAINEFQQSLRPNSDDIKRVNNHLIAFTRCSNDLNSFWNALAGNRINLVADYTPGS